MTKIKKKSEKDPSNGDGLIRVFIVDDHTMFRESIAAALELNAQISVLGMAGSGREALDKIKETSPDVILMDIKMPKMDGIKTCQLLKKAMPEANIIMLTVSEEEANVIEAIGAGASGYVLKSMPLNELVRAIKLVNEGKAMLHPDITKQLIAEFKRLTDKESNKFNLSDREVEVLQLLAYGYTNKEIAARLFISQQTVKSHVIHIFQKVGAVDRTEAVAIALRHGIVE